MLEPIHHEELGTSRGYGDGGFDDDGDGDGRGDGGGSDGECEADQSVQNFDTRILHDLINAILCDSVPTLGSVASAC